MSRLHLRTFRFNTMLALGKIIHFNLLLPIYAKTKFTNNYIILSSSSRLSVCSANDPVLK